MCVQPVRKFQVASVHSIELFSATPTRAPSGLAQLSCLAGSIKGVGGDQTRDLISNQVFSDLGLARSVDLQLGQVEEAVHDLIRQREVDTPAVIGPAARRHFTESEHSTRWTPIGAIQVPAVDPSLSVGLSLVDRSERMSKPTSRSQVSILDPLASTSQGA